MAGNVGKGEVGTQKIRLFLSNLSFGKVGGEEAFFYCDEPTRKEQCMDERQVSSGREVGQWNGMLGRSLGFRIVLWMW